MLPVKNTFMYLAIMYQPVEDGSYKASRIYLFTKQTRLISLRLRLRLGICDCDCVCVNIPVGTVIRMGNVLLYIYIYITYFHV